jgi:predicted transcriptional regulator
MLTAGQVRAARALLGIRQSDLAAQSGVAEITVKLFEGGARDARVSTAEKIRSALERAGVEFVEGGVKLKSAA